MGRPRKPDSTRVNVRVSPRARAQLEELGAWLFPQRAYTEGLVIERAIAELHRRTAREQREERRQETGA